MRRGSAAGRAAAVAALLVLGILVWWLLRATPEPATAAGPSASAAASRGAGPPAADRLPLVRAAVAPGALKASPPAAPVPVLATAPRTGGDGSAPAAADSPVWDLCGVGRLSVPRGAGAPVDPEQALAALPRNLGSDAMAEAYQRLFAVLDAGPPRWRAAAVMLRGSDAAGRPQVLALPELARASDDPVVALWAQQRCDLGASCLEMAGRWAQVEPQNLAPWVNLLARQPQRRAELIAHMAAATRFDRHEQALSLAVFEALPAGVAPYLQPALWIDVIGVEAAMSMPGFSAVFDHCRAPLAAGGVVVRECTTIARTLADRSDSALGIGLGLRLAERSGLALDDLARRRAELNLWRGPPENLFDRQQPLSCAGVARMRTWVEQRARLGELGALRARAAPRAASAASTPR